MNDRALERDIEEGKGRLEDVGSLVDQLVEKIEEQEQEIADLNDEIAELNSQLSRSDE